MPLISNPPRFMTPARLLVFLIGLPLMVCAVLMLTLFGSPTNQPNEAPLLVFCAAGVKQPISQIAENYRRECGMEVQLQFGGTGSLISQVSLNKQGDLLIVADSDATTLVQQKGIAREAIRLARQFPVVAVKRGNPLGIKLLEDLFREDVRLAVANPEAASIGKITKRMLADRWGALEKKVTVTKTMVTELAMDIKIGSVDAAIVWNSTVPQFAELEAVELPEFTPHVEDVSVTILAACQRPAIALRFARFMAASDRGSRIFREQGFDAIEGDPWTEPTSERRP